jgi:hypothetical protein
MTILVTVLLFAAGALGVPTAVLVAECVVGALSGERKFDSKREKLASAVVLIPAHDEELGIGATLRSIGADLDSEMRVLVVADNCSDGTAGVAREAGAEVVERRDSERRGKGYALSFGLDALVHDPPDVVIVVDADCRVSPGSLRRLAHVALTYHRPAQADYVLETADASAMGAISAFAFLVRNRVRARGLSLLRLPCQLAGSGMALPWQLIHRAAPTRDCLVEDLLMGVDLSIQGYPPLRVGDARISSPMPVDRSVQLTQRRRWETGRLSTVKLLVPCLVRAGIAQRRLDLLGMALDLLVPPLALHVGTLGTGAVAGVVGGLSGAGWIPAAACLGQLTAVGFGVSLAWLRDGRAVLPLRTAARIPGYLAWKFPMYLRFFLRGPEQAWVRTVRGHRQGQT